MKQSMEADVMATTDSMKLDRHYVPILILIKGIKNFYKVILVVVDVFIVHHVWRDNTEKLHEIDEFIIVGDHVME